MNQKTQQPEPSIEEMIESFDLFRGTDRPDDAKPVTFWIPDEYKAKYDALQDKSRKKFGKLMIEIVKQSIDKATRLKAG